MKVKNEQGYEVADYPFYNTAAAGQSHVKNYMLHKYKVDFMDKVKFPQWEICWRAYQGEVLKPNGKMKVQHGKFMQPELMEGIMELVAQSCATFEARGTPEYDAYLMRLPAELRNSYHRLNQMGAHYCVTLFFAQRGRESMATMEVADLVKEESDTMEFSYWREVKIYICDICSWIERSFRCYLLFRC